MASDMSIPTAPPPIVDEFLARFKRLHERPATAAPSRPPVPPPAVAESPCTDAQLAAICELYGVTPERRELLRQAGMSRRQVIEVASGRRPGG